MIEHLETLAAERVSAAVIAEWVGLHERSIRDLARRGIIHRDGRGCYEFRATLRLIHTHVAEQAAGRVASTGGADLVQERALLAREQAENVSMRNAAMRRDLVPLAEISQAVMGMIEVTKRHLARVPAKAFPSDHANRKRVADAIEAALIDLSAERAKPR